MIPFPIPSAKLFKHQIKQDFGDVNVQVSFSIGIKPKTYKPENGKKVYSFECDNGLREYFDRYAEYNLEFNKEPVNTGSIHITPDIESSEKIYFLVAVNQV